MTRHPRTELRDYVCYLLEQGWSAHQVKRTLRLTRREFDQLITPLSDSAAIADDPFSRDRRAARRCTGCGGLVFQWPCLACAQRERVERETTLRRAAYGHPVADVAEQSGLPMAYFDWSFGLTEPREGDFAIDPRSTVDQLVSLLGRWVQA